MFDNDICLCGNSEKCPLKDLCLRSEKHGPGIYTVSLFYTEDQSCDYFIARDRKKEVLKDA